MILGNLTPQVVHTSPSPLPHWDPQRGWLTLSKRWTDLFFLLHFSTVRKRFDPKSLPSLSLKMTHSRKQPYARLTLKSLLSFYYHKSNSTKIHDSSYFLPCDSIHYSPSPTTSLSHRSLLIGPSTAALYLQAPNTYMHTIPNPKAVKVIFLKAVS